MLCVMYVYIHVYIMHIIYTCCDVRVCLCMSSFFHLSFFFAQQRFLAQ